MHDLHPEPFCADSENFFAKPAVGDLCYAYGLFSPGTYLTVNLVAYDLVPTPDKEAKVNKLVLLDRRHPVIYLGNSIVFISEQRGNRSFYKILYKNEILYAFDAVNDYVTPCSKINPKILKTFELDLP